jgi:hypothetical protein
MAPLFISCLFFLRPGINEYKKALNGFIIKADVQGLHFRPGRHGPHGTSACRRYGACSKENGKDLLHHMHNKRNIKTIANFIRRCKEIRKALRAA